MGDDGSHDGDTDTKDETDVESARVGVGTKHEYRLRRYEQENEIRCSSPISQHQQKLPPTTPTILHGSSPHPPLSLAHSDGK